MNNSGKSCFHCFFAATRQLYPIHQVTTRRPYIDSRGRSQHAVYMGPRRRKYNWQVQMTGEEVIVSWAQLEGPRTTLSGASYSKLVMRIQWDVKHYSHYAKIRITRRRMHRFSSICSENLSGLRGVYCVKKYVYWFAADPPHQSWADEQCARLLRSGHLSRFQSLLLLLQWRQHSRLGPAQPDISTVSGYTKKTKNLKSLNRTEYGGLKFFRQLSGFVRLGERFWSWIKNNNNNNNKEVVRAWGQSGKNVIIFC